MYTFQLFNNFLGRFKPILYTPIERVKCNININPCTFHTVVVYSWSIGLFVSRFKPEQILRDERKRVIGKNNTLVEFWKKNTVGKQKLGKCFYLLIVSDAIMVLVLFLSIWEFKVSHVVSYTNGCHGEDDTELSDSKTNLNKYKRRDSDSDGDDEGDGDGDDDSTTNLLTMNKRI